MNGSSRLRRPAAALIALFAAAASGCASADRGEAAQPANQEMSAALARAASAPDAADRIRADLEYLAADARMGREAGTPGFESAAHYVAARMEALGAAPGAADGWFQETPLIASRRIPENASLAFTDENGQRHDFVHVADYLVGRPTSVSSFEIKAPAVFAGYGVSDPRGGRDDFAALDVEGKIVVLLTGAPATYPSEERAFFASTRRKLALAAERGAAGALILRTPETESQTPWERYTRAPLAQGMGLATDKPQLDTIAVLSAASGQRLLDASRLDIDLSRADDGEFPLGALGLDVSLRGAVTLEPLTSANVVGVIPGRDPALRGEAIVLTAHLDHIGETAADETGDAINNGAMDNAMGVATMLEAGRQLAAEGGARRTVLLVALTAEEKGLLGAENFVNNLGMLGVTPVANINLDMALTLYPFTDVVAFGAEQSTLGETIAAAAGKMGVALSPDPAPERNLFTRSDHFRFVEAGVPAVFLFTGPANGGAEAFENFMSTHYHRPSDDLSLPIDYEAAARFAELNYRIARMTADADAPPSWKPGNFFADLFGAGSLDPVNDGHARGD